MTKAWGPLGWATLHSVAAIYSDTPSDLEKALITRWMDAFQKTIVCEMCRSHFETLLRDYRSRYPDWNQSRSKLMLFALRAHNTVNSSISKPVYSAEDCMRLIKQNIPAERAAYMRQSYIVYIRKEWSRDMTMTGISTIKYIKDLISVEKDYWSQKRFSWDDVSTITEPVGSISPQKNVSSGHIRIQPRYSSIKLPTARFSFLSR